MTMTAMVLAAMARDGQGLLYAATRKDSTHLMFLGIARPF